MLYIAIQSFPKDKETVAQKEIEPKADKVLIRSGEKKY